MRKSPWHGKVAAICGATSGLGLSLVEQLASQGASGLALLARNETRLQALQSELEARYPHVKVDCIPTNFEDATSVHAAGSRIQATFGTLDLVLQCVGASDRGKLLDLDQAHLLSQLDRNVTTSLHALQGFHPLLKNSSGCIVFVGSLASLFAPRFLGGYAIAKHGLAALAQQARLELADDQIHVMLVCPGPIARDDAGTRYDDHDQAGQIPEAALRPGGGAQIKGLDAQRLSQDILTAAARRKPLLILPRSAGWLRILSSLSTALGDSILRRKTS